MPILLLAGLLIQSRCLSREGEGPAFFVSSLQDHCWVEACKTGGHCQIYDVRGARGVEEMTYWLDVPPEQARQIESFHFISGQCVEVTENIDGYNDVELTWMRAGKRMALGIPLHPDRMGFQDWQDLKGIGPALAEKIIACRQKNGAFGEVKNLHRVPGIGHKTIQSMQSWFIGHAKDLK